MLTEKIYSTFQRDLFMLKGYSKIYVKGSIIKGSLEEILPSYEKLRSVCVHVRDAKRSRLRGACVGTLGAGRVRRGCGAAPV